MSVDAFDMAGILFVLRLEWKASVRRECASIRHWHGYCRQSWDDNCSLGADRSTCLGILLGDDLDFGREILAGTDNHLTVRGIAHHCQSTQ